ncbi:MAG TPA: hypothetical protein VFJ16_08540 [Longimicrobium sp.]|nr:hypothetical protein [Longimicrobium sp.]
MNALAVTIDLDWACEAAIEETLDAFRELRVPVTVFATHHSPRVEAALDELEVGVHPYFAPDSSHGATIDDVVSHVLGLPHNLAAFRCHRFASCNGSREALARAGFRISSNVCTDLEVLPPFADRYGCLEVPIFMEDGGFLFRGHPLAIRGSLARGLEQPGMKVIVVHPMHFALNTPHFDYMATIKQRTTRERWRAFTRRDLDALRWRSRGIRDLVLEMVSAASAHTTLGAVRHAGSTTLSLA